MADYLSLNPSAYNYKLSRLTCAPTAQCLELPSLANGFIQYGVVDFMDMTPGFDEGTIATHACNTGFALIGNTRREWSGQTPECVMLHHDCILGVHAPISMYIGITISSRCTIFCV